MILYQSLRKHPVAACIHCGKHVSIARRKRRLCRQCHGNLFIRRRYPHATPALAALGCQSASGRDFSGPAPLPPRTALDPGKAKLKTLQARARRRQALFRADEPSFPVHMPDPQKDWGGMRLWRLLIALCPAIADDLQVISNPSRLDSLAAAGVA